MNEFAFKSSDAWMMIYFLFPPTLGAMFLIAAIVGWRQDMAPPGVLFLGGIGLWDLVFTVRAWDRWRSVEVDLSGVYLNHGGQRTVYAWDRVESCVPVRGRPLIAWYQRTLYQLTLTDPNTVVFFVPGAPKPRPQGLWEPHYESMLDVIRGEMAKSARGHSHAI